jgi:hypothetical protein
MRLSVNKSVAAPVLGVGMAALVAGCASLGSPASTSTQSAPGAGAGTQGATASPASGASSTASATTAPDATGTPGAPGTTTSPSGGAAAPAVSTATCATSDLKITQGTGGAGAGSVYIPIEFTNTSASPCTLYGYPGVALTTSMAPASQVGAAASRSDARPKTLVTLAPGATASATLQIAQALNYPTASCAPVSASYLQVYPPGQTTAVYLSYKGKGCAKPVFVLGIAAIQPGTGAA